MDARAFSDRLVELLSKEHHAMADFLVALAEFDARRGWEELGYRSLFFYLHQELNLSKGAAYYRQVGARLVRSYPAVLKALRDGELCVTGLVEVEKVLTPENCAEILPRFFHRSRKEAKVVAAAIAPVEAVPSRELVTRVSAPTSPPGAPAAALVPVGIQLVQPAEPAREPRQPGVLPRFDKLSETEAQPLTALLRRLHLTVTQPFLDKVERARDGMSNARPTATTVEVLEAGLDHLLKHQAKLRGETSKPRTRRKQDPLSAGDGIPAEVKRAVWARDGGCCQWRLDAGGICGSRRRLQLDHIQPRALGGLPTVENTRLLCLLCRSRHKAHYADCRIIPRRYPDRLALKGVSLRDAA